MKKRHVLKSLIYMKLSFCFNATSKQMHIIDFDNIVKKYY